MNPDYTYSVNVGGTTREYVLRYPKNYDRNHRYPLVFLWHGTGGSAMEYDYTQVEQTAPEGSAIFVLPIGLDYAWAVENWPKPPYTGWETFNENDRDLQFFDAMLAQIKAAYCVDEQRVFASGHSIGGYMCNYLACQRGNVIRAIAPIAGGGPESWYLSQHPCVGHMAARIIHGASDQVVALASGNVSRDYYLDANGCSLETVATDDAPCLRYNGCNASFPVDMCTFQEVGHADFNWSTVGHHVWSFFGAF